MNEGILASPAARYLTSDWADWTPPHKLERIRSLLEAADADAGAVRRPDAAVVGDIVQRLQEEAGAPKRSLWERFKDWLRSLLDRHDQPEDAGWFSQWLREHVPLAGAIDAFLYLVLGGMIAALGWLVYRELRAGGMLPGRWRPRAAPAPAAAVPAAPAQAGATEADAPSVLLGLLLGELRRLGRVQDRLGMTHRELGRAARFDAPVDGATFGRVLGAAEQVRYGNVPPSPGSVQAVVEAGRRLLESLMRKQRVAP